MKGWEDMDGDGNEIEMEKKRRGVIELAHGGPATHAVRSIPR